jgi:hypothetical protein
MYVHVWEDRNPKRDGPEVLSLLLVPILAGLWPSLSGILGLVDHGPQILERLRSISEVVAEEPAKAQQLLSELMLSIDDGAVELEATRPEQTKLPFSFVLAFFAALASVLGSIIYEVFAPQVVKSYSRDEYVEKQVSHYHSSPTDQQIESAVVFLQTNDKKRLATICRTIARQSRPQINYDEDALADPVNRGFPIKVEILKAFANELLTAEAEERYDLAAFPLKSKQSARRAHKMVYATTTAATWSLVMFGSAGLAVLVILGLQASSVLRAAGLL